MDFSRETLQPFRRTNRGHINEYVGSLYSGDDSKATIVNLIHQFVETYTLLLVGGEVRTIVETSQHTLKPSRLRLQTAVNNVSREIHLTETVRQAVLDAIFRMGVVKVYQGEGREAQIEEDVYREVGRPYARLVAFDDLVYDTSRSRWSEVGYVTDEYDVPMDTLLGNDHYNQRRVKQLTPQTTDDYDSGGGRLVRHLSTGSIQDPAYLENRVTLMDVWLPRTGELAVLSRYDPTLLPLDIQDWTGPNEGPYHRLFLGDVPDNIMPVSAVDQLYPLHKTFNNLARKAVRQAETQKTIPWYEPGSRDDMQALVGQPDLKPLKINNKDGIGVMEFGGPNQGNLAFMLQTLQLFDRSGGNLSVLAGLGAQSDTVGQDQMIHAQASNKLAKYGEKVKAFINSLVTSLAHLIWEDDAAEVPGEYVEPVAGIAVPQAWSPEYRDGDFVDYNFQIDAHALGYEAPEAKLAKLERNVATILQMWPLFQAAGGVFNARELLDKMAEYGNAPYLKSVISFTEEPPAGGSETARQSPNTTRTNVRKNVSAGPTDQEANRIMSEMLTQNNPQSNGQQQGAAVSIGG
jgi:hypothetical protein